MEEVAEEVADEAVEWAEGREKDWGAVSVLILV